MCYEMISLSGAAMRDEVRIMHGAFYEMGNGFRTVGSDRYITCLTHLSGSDETAKTWETDAWWRGIIDPTDVNFTTTKFHRVVAI